MGTNASFYQQARPLNTLITATGAGVFDINPLVRAGYTQLRADMLGGGGGGGSGCIAVGPSVISGGGGGANGAFSSEWFALTSLLIAYPTGLIPYQVGLGTAGGAAVSGPNAFGIAGGATDVPQYTYLGSLSGFLLGIARGGGPGQGGVFGATAGGLAPESQFGSPGGGFTQANGVTTFAQRTSGAGGSIDGAGTPQNGNSAGSGYYSPANLAGGVSGAAPGGIVDGALPVVPMLPTGRFGTGLCCPGGAASITTAAQAGADAPASSGLGGGGGGAAVNGLTSGRGGNGGSGYLRFVAF